MARPGPLDRALLALDGLRDSLRAAGNGERAGLFSCDGCVGWCCREGWNSMRATPLEAEAILRLLERRGELQEGLRLAERAPDPDRHAEERGAPRTYTCPFLTAGNRCGIHAAKPLGCITFTPVRDGGCDQDGTLLAAALEEAGGLSDGVAGDAPWTDLPLPLALVEAYRFFPRATKQSRQ